MFSVSNIPHPFLTTPGTSQQERLPASLDPQSVSVDDRSTADLLGLITRFSTLVNFYNNDLERGSWQSFFSKSLPMLLAKLHNFDADELEAEFEQITLQIEEAPSKANLKLMFDFVWKEMIEPLNELQSQFSEANPELELELNQPITRNLRDAIRSFIALSNSANKWYCTGIRDFYPLLEFPSWGLDIPDLYLSNENFHSVESTSKDNMITLKNDLSDAIAPFFEVIRTLANRASDYLDQELDNIEPGRRLQKPHLGLLFAFLKLFRKIQDHFNDLSTRHLEFFYEKVMGIQPQNLKADHAHIILNIQKQLVQKEVKKGTLLKDGKDLNKQDIVYSFVEDVLFDKAQIADVRTLYLNTVSGYNVGLLNAGVIDDGNDGTGDLEIVDDRIKKDFVEGIYIATDATAADGISEALEDGESWPTLGSKYSKYHPEVNPASLDLKSQAHPDARLGFVLASPVLLLKEGQRYIEIDLTCSVKDLDCIETPSFRDKCVELQRAIQGRRYHFTQEIYEFLVDKGLCETAGEDELSLLGLLYNEETGEWREDGLWILEEVLEIMFPSVLVPRTTIPIYLPATNILLTELPVIIPDSDDPTIGIPIFYGLDENGETVEVEGVFVFDPTTGNPLFYPDGAPVIGIPLVDADTGNAVTDADNNPVYGIPMYDDVGNLFIDPITEGLIFGILIFETIEVPLLDIDGLPVTDVEGNPLYTEITVIELDGNGVPVLTATVEVEENPLEAIVLEEQLVVNPNLALIRQELELRQLFRLSFSGEEEWVIPNPENVEVVVTFEPECGLLPVSPSSTDLTNNIEDGDTESEPSLSEIIIPDEEITDVTLTFKIKLDPEDPAVTFPDTEALGEGFSAEMPLVKIEMDDELKLVCKSEIYLPSCTLERCCPKQTIMVSAYHFLRHLAIDESCITVEVCGLKDIIVQNDEGQQDVNSEVLPFGSLPKLYNDFYIGSREVFCKKWKDVWVNVTWKDRPEDFKKHYRHYNYEAFEDGSQFIDVDSFQFLPSLLDDGTWVDALVNPNPNAADNPRDLRYLFHNENAPAPGTTNCDPILPRESEFAPFCPSPLAPLDPGDISLHNSIDVYHFDKGSDFPKSNDPSYACIQKEQVPLDITTRESFLRFSLRGVGFQHDRYAFVLVKQMSNLSEVTVDLFTETSIAFNLEGARTCAEAIKNKVQEVIAVTNNVEAALLAVCQDVGAAVATENAITTAIADIQAAIEEANDIDIAPNNPGGLNPAPLTAQDVQEDYQEIIDNIEGFNNIVSSNVNTLFNILEDISEGLDDTSPGSNANGAKQLLEALQVLLIASEDQLDPGVTDDSLEALVNDLCTKLDSIGVLLGASAEASDGLPLEPYTPSIKEISLDYCAKAEGKDISLIHIYPFHQTHKIEDIEAQPCLLPTYTDKGNLYIGFEQLLPGNVINVLFQLAEGTANSEIKKAKIKWHYLSRNRWLRLQDGFHIIEDNTFGLTRSGIVKINIPRNITNEENTIMPNGLHWVKVSAFNNTESIGEVIGIHTQAALVSYQATELNDRASMLTEAGNITKTVQSDSKIKKIVQPYDSFGGKMKEAGNNLYLRFSERLRHKGRAISMFDYERLVLQNFSEIYRVKCVTHALSLGAEKYRRDLEVAPGYVLLAVIPDPNQLKAGDRAVPRVPVSLLEDIQRYLAKRTNPFLRLKVDNPRYEAVDVQVHVQLHQGRSEAYYSELLAEEIRGFLAPWRSGNLEQLTFGRSLSRSELVYFIETRPYVDYLCAIYWIHQDDLNNKCLLPIDTNECYDDSKECELWERYVAPNPETDPQTEPTPHQIWQAEYDEWQEKQAIWKNHSKSLLAPLSARSILVAGKIKVCTVYNPCGVKIKDSRGDITTCSIDVDNLSFNCENKIYSASCPGELKESPETEGGGLTPINIPL